jgi:membrane protease YdiL (CAAX protease family)
MFFPRGNGADAPGVAMTTALDTPVGPRRGRPAVAWAAIVLAAATAFAWQLWSQRTAEGKKAASLLMLEMQAREFVALAEADRGQKEKLYQQVEPLKEGPQPQRLRFVVLAGEFVGPAEALKQLHDLRPAGDDAEVAAVLDKLYRDYGQDQFAAPSLSAGERQLLRDRLGWYGELALAPEGAPDAAARAAVLRPARRAFYGTIGLGLALFGFGVVGLCLVIGMAILVVFRQVRLHFRTGSADGAVYAETFAIWMWLFLGLGKGATYLPVGPNRLLVGSAAALASLVALAWPVLRGVPFATVRRDIGLFWKDRPESQPLARDDAYAAPLFRRPAPPWMEPVFGLASYAATLPLLLIGALLTLALMALAKRLFGDNGDPLGLGSDPSHPIAGFLLTANWWGRVQVLFAAAVGAPIVEETMFRGVLYRHVREATGRWGRWLSVLASAVVVSFIFAVIHPQGLVAVPALMALAIGFSLAREWRGTLVPSMVAHGVNNFMVTVLLLVSTS